MSNKSEINFQNGLAMVLAIDAFADAPEIDKNYPYHFWHYSNKQGLLANCSAYKVATSEYVGFLSKQGEYDIYVTTMRIRWGDGSTSDRMYYIMPTDTESYPGTGSFYKTFDFVNWTWAASVSGNPIDLKGVTYKGHTVGIVASYYVENGIYSPKIMHYDTKDRPSDCPGTYLDWLCICFIKHHYEVD